VQFHLPTSSFGLSKRLLHVMLDTLVATATKLVFINAKLWNNTAENMQFVLVSNRNSVFNVFFC
jgi:hypothetical protein